MSEQVSAKLFFQADYAIFVATCAISKVFSPLSTSMDNRSYTSDRNVGQWWALRVGNAIRDREDRVSTVPNRSVSAILSRASKVDLLFS